MPSSTIPCTSESADARRIRCFLSVCNRLASGGQPMPEQFAGLKAAGYDVVVNLLPVVHDTAVECEADLVRAQGMEYAHVPVIWTKPTRADACRFFAIMDDCARRKRRVFVHCAVNMRASAFLYLWRTLRGGVDPDDAEADLHDIWVPDGWWAEFITDISQEYASRCTIP